MTPLTKKSGFNNNKVLPPLSHLNSHDGERDSSPLLHATILEASNTIKFKKNKKIVISDKKVTKFAGLRIIVGSDNEKVDVIQEMDGDSKESSLRRGNSMGSNLNPFQEIDDFVGLGSGNKKSGKININKFQ